MSRSALVPAHWQTGSRDAQDEEALRSEHGVGPLLAAVLAARGLQGQVQEFLNPTYEGLADPSRLPDYGSAIKALMQTRDEGGMVFVHGDYDADGVTSTAILTRFLRKAGFNVTAYVPHRIKRGYGVHDEAVRDAKDAGAALFLTCDCGVSAHEQMAAVRAAGMRSVVTDHHLPKDSLPDADAVVNPHRADSTYPFEDLCGAGVAWQLCAGLGRELGHDLNRVRDAFVDLAGIGTIADVMPLLGENRIIAARGLARMPETKKLGLIELLKVSKKWGPREHIDSTSIGFQVGPRINAVGRIGDAAHALTLLISEDRAEAASLAASLDKLNTERRAIQDRVMEEAMEEAEVRAETDRVIVVMGEGWHEGVIGVVAGKIKEAFHRPAIVLSVLENGTAKGSARSIPGFHLGDAIRAAEPWLMGGGGHAMAAGVQMRPENLDALRAALNAEASGLPAEVFEPRLMLDAEIGPGELDPEQAYELDQLQPFGAAHPEPTFLIRGATVASPRPLGQDGRHLRLTIDRKGECAPAVAFGLAEQLSAPGQTWDFAARLQLNRFNGRTEARWLIDQARPST